MGSEMCIRDRDVGVPTEMVTDNAKEYTESGTVFQKTARFLNMLVTTIEPHTPRQNPAERVIGELRRKVRDVARAKNISRRLWDYLLIWTAEVISRTWNPKFERTGIEEITGETPDISEWIEFDFYDRVWFWDKPDDEDNPKPGRWLGVSHRVSPALCYYVLTEAAQVESRTSVQVVRDEELKTDGVKAVSYTHLTLPTICSV